MARPKSYWESGVNENVRLYAVRRGAIPIGPALKQHYAVVSLHESGPPPSLTKLNAKPRVRQHLRYGRDEVNIAYTPNFVRIDTR